MTGQKGNGTVQELADAMDVDPEIIRREIKRRGIQPVGWVGGQPVYAEAHCLSVKFAVVPELDRRDEHAEFMSDVILTGQPRDRAGRLAASGSSRPATGGGSAPMEPRAPGRCRGTTVSPGTGQHRGAIPHDQPRPTLSSREPAARGPACIGAIDASGRAQKKGGAQ